MSSVCTTHSSYHMVSWFELLSPSISVSHQVPQQNCNMQHNKTYICSYIFPCQSHNDLKWRSHVAFAPGGDGFIPCGDHILKVTFVLHGINLSLLGATVPGLWKMFRNLENNFPLFFQIATSSVADKTFCHHFQLKNIKSSNKQNRHWHSFRTWHFIMFIFIFIVHDASC